MSSELQSVGNNPGNGTATTIAGTLGSNVTTGSLLIAAISYDLGAGSNTISTVQDAIGNTYTLIAETRDATQQQGSALYYCRQAVSGSSTTTVTFNTAVGFRRLIVVEFSTTTDVLDTYNTQPRTATNTSTDGITCAAHTPNVANTLVVAFCEVHASQPTCTLAAGTNYTEADEIAVNSPVLSQVEWRDKSSASAETSTWTLTAGTASNYLAFSAAFKASTAETQSFYASRRRSVRR